MPTKKSPKGKNPIENIRNAAGSISYASPMVTGHLPHIRYHSAAKLVAKGLSATEIINWAAPYVAAYLSNVALSITKPHWARIDAAKFLLMQHLAQLRAQGLVDSAGNRITSYRRVLLLAEQFISGEKGEVQKGGEDALQRLGEAEGSSKGEDEAVA